MGTISGVSTLRPGLLVSLKTSIRGNVTYDKTDLEPEHIVASGEAVSRWETKREVADPAEYEEAKKARSKCRTVITRVCAASAFGLLCPQANAGTLDAAIAEAREIADDFNRGAKVSQLAVYVITGRIAPDDAEAVRAINSEISDLLETMRAGIQGLDVEAVRDAASRAKDVGAMLSTDAQSKIKTAIDAARATCRQIVKAGDQAATEIDQATLRTIMQARAAFLDLDEAGEIRAPEAAARGIDLDPADAAPPPMLAQPRLFDL